MQFNRLAPLAPPALLTFALAACVPASEPAPPPPPPPAPAPAPAPTPTPTPAPTFANWMDAPQTRGDWSYARLAESTQAVFAEAPGTARFAVTCRPATRQVSLVRPVEATGTLVGRVLTETAERVIEFKAQAGQPPTVAVTLSAQDPLLDAIAFSKGRFAVETQAQPTLYLPAWPEISRVIEDCR